MALLDKQIRHLIGLAEDAGETLESLEGRLLDNTARLTRIERLLKTNLRVSLKEEAELMAQRQTLDAMNAAVTANTAAVSAARDALQHFADQHTADLAALKQAIENAANLDDPEVAAAVATMEANNVALQNAVGPTAAAIVANTPAAA